MNKNKIGARVKQLRFRNNLSQKELAEKLDVELSTIIEIECGENPPTVIILLKLKRIFNVTVDWILTGESSGDSIDFNDLVGDYNEDLKEMIEELKNNYSAKIKVLSFFYDYKAKNLSKFLHPKHLG